MSASPATALQPRSPHLHIAGEICPWCEQPIPHDKFAEISARIAEREGARFADMTTALEERYAHEKTEIEAKSKTETALARQEAETAAQEKIAEAVRERATAEAALQDRITQAEASGAGLRLQLEEMQLGHAEALRRLQENAKAQEIAIRQEAQAAAEATLREKLDAAEQGRAAAEAALQAKIAASDQQIRDLQATSERLAADAAAREAAIRADAEAASQEKLVEAQQQRTLAEAELRAQIAEAQASGADLRTQVEQLQHDHAATVERLREEAGAQAVTIREEAQAAAEVSLREKIAAAEQGKAAVEQQLHILQETSEADTNRRLQELREASEQDKIAAVNAERSKAFEENLRLSETVQQLQRKLDNKTSGELGEGAEIDLYEALKAAFEGDRITRINRGKPGADLLHVVIHNDKECGSIIYDSKNRNSWQTEYVTKLAQDQMAAKAEHAILATRKFPAGARELHFQHGVILAAPARVVALVQIVRQHVIQDHTMRMSSAERAEKKAALYDFITSERSAQLFARIDSLAQQMLTLQEKEIRVHKSLWTRQGKLYRSVQRVDAEISAEIDRIIGAAGVGDLGL